MVDYVKQLFDQAKSEGVSVEGQDFDKLRETATTKYNELQAAAQPIMKVIEDPEAVAKLKGGVDKEKNLDLLRSEYNVGIAVFCFDKVGTLTLNRSRLSRSTRSTTLASTSTRSARTRTPPTSSTTSSSSPPLST